MRSRNHKPRRSLAFFVARRRQRQEGVAAVEFALVLPFLIILLMGLIDFGHLFFSVNTITNAAREAARRAAVQDSATSAEAAADEAANQYLAPAGLAPGSASGSIAANCSIKCPTVTVTALSAANPDTIRVVITIVGPFQNITGFSYAVLPGFTNPFDLMVDLSATSEMRWELTP